MAWSRGSQSLPEPWERVLSALSAAFVRAGVRKRSRAGGHRGAQSHPSDPARARAGVRVLHKAEAGLGCRVCSQENCRGLQKVSLVLGEGHRMGSGEPLPCPRPQSGEQ